MADVETQGFERYRTHELLGRGGMGEVHLAEDLRVGRMVAIKVVRDEVDSRRHLGRFVREARIQGQLEHPAIVPVYDLDDGAGGRPYFVMKRVSGVTLAQIVGGLNDGDASVAERFPLRRLLAAFQQLCLAVDYAHTRGIVHRDLKPSNVILGEFGELYLLDWGVAKVASDPDAHDSAETSAIRLPGEAEATGSEVVLGTIGYMAPEQLLESGAVDRRADVYSLGAILYFLLAREPLHGRGSFALRARSTQLGADARPSVRAPALALPPELDAICVRATAADPDARYQGARELHDAVERFLSGDRDAQLRSELTRLHVERATDALEAALGDDAASLDARRTAMREAGLALALDPRSEDAAAMVARLMLAPPPTLPDEVRSDLAKLFARDIRLSARAGAYLLSCLVVLLGVAAATGTRPSAYLVALAAPAAILAAFEWHVSRRRRDPTTAGSTLVGLAMAAAIGGTGGLAGPLVVPPILALALAAIFSAQHGLGRSRIAVVVAACVAGTLPGALDGALRDDRALVLAFVASAIVLVSALLWRMCSAIARSRARVELQAWHLRQLVAGADATTAPRRDDTVRVGLHTARAVAPLEPHGSRGASSTLDSGAPTVSR